MRRSDSESDLIAFIKALRRSALPFYAIVRYTHVGDGEGKQFERLTADAQPSMVEQAVLASQDGRMPDGNERERFHSTYSELMDKVGD